MKRLIVIAVLLTAMVTGAFASPAGSITDWLFGTPADNFMEVQWHVYTGFNKFYAQAGLSSGKADLGFATKFGKAEDGSGGLYLGLAYAGNIFNQVDIGYTESEINFKGVPNTKTKQYGAINLTPATARPDHDIGILIGVANMGFLFNLNTDYQLFEVKEDALIGGTQYKSYKAERGTITPSIKWGMAKDLTEKGIRPAVKLSLGFDINNTEVEQYQLAYGSTTAYTTYGTAINTDNSTEFGLAFNLGGFTLKKNRERI